MQSGSVIKIGKPGSGKPLVMGDQNSTVIVTFHSSGSVVVLFDGDREMSIHEPLRHHGTMTAILFPFSDHQPVAVSSRDCGVDVDGKSVPNFSSEFQVFAVGLPEFRPFLLVVTTIGRADPLAAPTVTRSPSDRLNVLARIDQQHRRVKATFWNWYD